MNSHEFPANPPPPLYMSCSYVYPYITISYIVLKAGKRKHAIETYGKGASINYVDKQGKSELAQYHQCYRSRCSKFINEWGRGQNLQNPVNVVYECSQRQNWQNNSVRGRFGFEKLWITILLNWLVSHEKSLIDIRRI